MLGQETSEGVLARSGHPHVVAIWAPWQARTPAASSSSSASPDEPCVLSQRVVQHRDTIEIPHPPGAEMQWDWNELGEAPWGGEAHLLAGTLPCSGRIRAVFVESEEQAFFDLGHGPGPALFRRQRQALAFRPHGERGEPRHRQGAGILRTNGEALRRGRCRPLPSPDHYQILPHERRKVVDLTELSSSSRRDQLPDKGKRAEIQSPYGSHTHSLLEV